MDMPLDNVETLVKIMMLDTVCEKKEKRKKKKEERKKKKEKKEKGKRKKITIRMSCDIFSNQIKSAHILGEKKK